MKKSNWLPLAAGVLLASGCGKSPDIASVDPASATKIAGTKNGSGLTTPSDPKEVVRLFLNSMRQGNGAQLSSLLSSLAREEIKRKQLEIAPLGSPLATFQMGEVAEQDGGMLVSSTWTEPEQDGQPATELEVVWELRKETEGWRICGMAVDPKNGDEIQIVDFEKLEPEQPTQDPQRVASLPNAPGANLGNAGNTGGLGGSIPPNSPQTNVSVPNNVPAGNFPPAANFGQAPTYGQAPNGNFPPANNALPPSAGNPPSNLPSNLPPSRYPTNPPPTGLPQPSGQYGNSTLPPANLPGNFALPPANEPNQIRR